MNKIIENIKNNMNYFINSDDNFNTCIEKIIQKLKENRIVIVDKGYEILEFKENFSKVSFKISLGEEVIERVFVLSNQDFLHQVLIYKRKVIELFIAETFGLKFDNFSKDNLLTNSQLSYLKDKSLKYQVLISRELEKYNVNKIEELTKSQASNIITLIQERRTR